MTVPGLIRTAWASASTFRGSDMRGGANGARLRLAPQKDWAVNNPDDLAKVLKTLAEISAEFNKSLSSGKKVSLADVIVLGGADAVEEAAEQAGHSVEVPFTPGRMGASQEQTAFSSLAVLESTADGFRNYFSDDKYVSPAEMLVEKSAPLRLTASEMAVLIGSMRALNANTGQAEHGVLTDKPGTLSNDFFINLLDTSTEWKQSSMLPGLYEGYNRSTDELKWAANLVDLISGSNSELRAIAEVCAVNDGSEKLVEDFVHAWTKVMDPRPLRRG